MSDVRRPCPTCNRDAQLVSGREIYLHRPDLNQKPFWACLPAEPGWAATLTVRADSAA